MKSWIILAGLAIGLTAVVTVAVPLLATNSSTDGPGVPAPVATDVPAGSVEVEGDLTYKFGVMAQDSDGIHSWVFKNNGKGPLELRNLGTDCSCTIAQLGKPTSVDDKAPSMLKVGPGSSEVIEIKWNTRKIDGPYKKNARIGTNDPARPEVTLQVQGIVKPAITMYPPDGTINFQTVSNDEIHERSIAIFSGDRPDFKLTRVASSNPALIGASSRSMTEEEAKSLNAEKGYLINISLKMAAKLGPFGEDVIVETDHPSKKEIRIPVLGRLTGPVTIVPDRLVMREVSSSDGGSQDLVVWIRGQTSTKFTVVDKPDFLEVDFQPIEQPAESKGSKYKMIVRVIPGTIPGKIVGEIVIKTDHPQASEVKVPVDVLVQGGN
ncbi:DUF1573 domain-containing protein [Tundrisphaera lichenicola]|uniref:DUF1573 domain-containing protein n=1 Tax=Tundrisphaera lichenicola TaxID=2029860 RepID=UPI003EBD47EC